MDNNKLMVYGILKRGFALDLTKHGCKFLGECQLVGANLYGREFRDATGSWTGVGLRFDDDPEGVAYGELFEIPDRVEHPEGKRGWSVWDWLDSIEQNGYCYTRKIVRVEMWPEKRHKLESGLVATMDALERIQYAWVYEHTYPGCKYDKSNLIEGGKF